FWFANDATRISFALYNVDDTDLTSFSTAVHEGIRQTFELYGYTPMQINQYFAAAGAVVMTKTRGPKSIGRLSSAMNEFLLMDVPINRYETYQLLFAQLTNQLIVRFNDRELEPIEALAEFFDRFEQGESLNLDGTMVGQLEMNQALKTAHVTNQEDLSVVSTEMQEAFDLLIRIDLDFSKPVRRIFVPKEKTFADLHEIIQAAYEWENRHLYQFEGSQAGERYQIVPEEFANELDHFENVKIKIDKDTRLSELLKIGTEFTYVYDFGDEWRHRIFVRGMEQTATTKCVLALGTRPPEDIGGSIGFDFMLEMLANIELLPVAEQKQLQLLIDEMDKFYPNMKKINQKLRKL
ncbi:MAG: plasmid pRiA4b ORF-3 family protein, partial [Culicoidibacterales bacterium]